jgi:hypothetical protein
MKHVISSATFTALIIAGTLPGYAQPLSGPPADPQYKYSTPMPPGVAAPAKVETRFGTLNFFDGVPDEASTEKIYDNLDFQRAVQAYLLALPVVSQVANRDGILAMGPANITVPIWENLVDSTTVELTANDNTPYTWFWVDLRKGPLVIEAPPKVLGLVDDIWYHWNGDIGFTGPDKGRGGKYLLLPPGYKGNVPKGYFVVRPGSFSVWAGWRSFLVDGNPKPGVDAVKKVMKMYPLSQAANPPKLNFVNMSGKPFNMVGPADFRFWEMLNKVVQDEPTDTVDATTLGFWASVGIRKGQPFAPDERMKKILTEAAAVGDATGRALAYRVREKAAYIYDNRQWKYPFIGGYKFEWQPGVPNLSAAAMFFFAATGVTPGDGYEDCRRRLHLPVDRRGLRQPSVRRRQELQAPPPAENPGQDLLVSDCVRHANPFDAANEPAVPECEQPAEEPARQCRRLGGCVVRTESARGQGPQLGPDDSRQGVVHDPAPLRPAGAVVQTDLATRRHRVGQMSSL